VADASTEGRPAGGAAGPGGAAAGSEAAGGAERGPAAISVPPARDAAMIAVAVAAASTAGPLIAATAAPALAIAAWRNLMAGAVLLPAALLTRRAELRRLDRRGWALSGLAGVFLAAHFVTWVPSVTLTSVASSTALVVTQPVWAALLARAGGQHVSRAVWVGILVAVAGAVLVTGADVTLSARAVAGDVLAVLGGVFAAAYVTAGAAVRARLSTTAYTAVCYSTCAVILAVVCLAAGQRLGGYPAGSWVKLVALTAGAQLLGHSLINVALRTTSPTVVSLALLFEAPGAALIAAVWLDQLPPASAVPGLLVLLVGLALVVRAGARGVPVE
jgi:drug/metabolite transporter (DMT)-like permease